jgi:NAD(P)-dependent dehydrogenase (short-subunit alcohol dehydrogenase family)
MRIDLNGKRALITGSTVGIGFAIAAGLAESGAAVVINGRSDKSVETAKKRLLQKLPQANVEGVTADLSTAKGASAFVEQAGDADILINNVGIFEPKPFVEIADEDWHRFFDINVMSGVRLSRHYLPLMMKRDWGRIVFISSESGLNIPVEMIHYGMTKTAQLAVSRGLAEAVAGTGITVNCVLPGPTKSRGVIDFVDALAKAEGKSVEDVEKEFFEKFRPTSLIKRFATPEEVASLVAYVVSPLASATTGSALRVDGGVLKSAF